MGYEFIKTNHENSFYPVTENKIKEVEKELDLKIPKELVAFYKEVGYGFIKGSEFNINRIMGPYSVRDFRLRVNDYEFYPDIEIYEEFENNKLIFFEGSESALMSLELNENNKNPVYYYDIQIATSLEEF
ncbi:SMI1/KNR4 family protein [Bacillus vallismortis]|nr:SMI1/KNR4 family protein [Bacillus vallismortis]